MATSSIHEDLPNGPMAAALLGGGLGAAGLGLMTVLAEGSTAIRNALNWWNPAGPLSSKTGVGVMVFLGSWVVLHWLYRGKEVNFARVRTITLLLLGLGLLGTFPPFFELFAGE